MSLRELQDPVGDQVALDLRGAAHDALGSAVQVHLRPRVVVAAVAGAADRQRGVADGLLGRGHEQLVDRALGPVGDAVEAVGQPAAHVGAQHLGLDDRPGRGRAGPRRRGASGSLAHPVGELLHRLAVAGDVAELAGLALVAHDGHGERASPRPARRSCRRPGHGRRRRCTSPNSVVMPLIMRSGRCSMPGWSHRHRERGDALVLGDVGVGAGEHEAPVGHVGVARSTPCGR